MKNYKFLTKKEIDEMIIEYDQTKKNITKLRSSIQELIRAMLDMQKSAYRKK